MLWFLQKLSQKSNKKKIILLRFCLVSGLFFTVILCGWAFCRRTIIFEVRQPELQNSRWSWVMRLKLQAWIWLRFTASYHSWWRYHLWCSQTFSLHSSAAKHTDIYLWILVVRRSTQVTIAAMNKEVTVRFMQ